MLNSSWLLWFYFILFSTEEQMWNGYGVLGPKQISTPAPSQGNMVEGTAERL